jgi:tRNA (cytidine/uridine-2'-O-)-methyltransferase
MAMVAIALYQPDIPPNAGALLRLTACLGVGLHLIGPTGFTLADRHLKRAALDYLAAADLTEHTGWTAFQDWRRQAGSPRLVLLTTRADRPYTGFAFAAGDLLLFGRETAGVPDHVHAAADAALAIPIRRPLRSLNVATAAAMVLGEALRQTDAFPPLRPGGEAAGAAHSTTGHPP